MLTPVVLRASERAALTAHETFALEYLLLERLSENARDRRSGDDALLLAIRAADYSGSLASELGDVATEALLERVRHSDVARLAVERAVVWDLLAHDRAA